MSDDLTYEQVLEKLPAYALGVLEPDEMLAIDTYLRRHQALLARLQESEQAAAQLAYLAPTAPLPADARERLLQRVRANLETQAAPKTTGETATKPARSAPVAQESDDYPGSSPTGRAAAAWQRLLGALNGWSIATAAAVLALLVGGLYVAQLQSRLSQIERQTDTLQAEVQQLRSENNQLRQTHRDLEQQFQAEQDRLAFVVNADPNDTILLPGTDEAPDASGAFYLGNDRQGLLVLRNLEELPRQQTYQLWLIPANEAPVPAGLVDLQANGPTWLQVQIPPEAQAFTAVGLSIEPAGGSPAPTGPIVLLGSTS